MAVNFPPLDVTTAGRLVPQVVPATVTLFDGFGRAAGRFMVVVFGALFWTQCKTTENFIMEHHPRWLALSDIRTHHNQIHYFLGFFFMGIPIVTHIALLFVAAI